MIMLPSWIFFGFAAVLIWVVGTFFDKYLLEKYFGDDEDQSSGPGALLIFSAFFSLLVGLVILYIGFNDIKFTASSSILGMTIGALNGFWILLYLFALNRSEVSKVVPFFQTVPIFGYIFASLLLDEFLLSSQIIAIGGVILGALILMHYKKNSYLRVDVITLGFMLVACALVALTETIFKYVATDSTYWTAAFWTSVGFTFFGFFLYIFVNKYRFEFHTLIRIKTKQILTANSANEVIDNGAEFIFFFAVTVGPVALVQSLNAFQPVIALVSALAMGKLLPRFFGEELLQTSLLQKVVGITLVTLASAYFYINLQ